MRDVGIDALRRRRDLHEIATLIAEVDDALDHAQTAVVGADHVTLSVPPTRPEYAGRRGAAV